MGLISKRTRNEFRETLVGCVLREIEMFFEGAGVSKNEDYVPSVDGARRSLGVFFEKSRCFLKGQELARTRITSRQWTEHDVPW